MQRSSPTDNSQLLCLYRYFTSSLITAISRYEKKEGDRYFSVSINTTKYKPAGMQLTTACRLKNEGVKEPECVMYDKIFYNFFIFNTLPCPCGEEIIHHKSIDENRMFSIFVITHKYQKMSLGRFLRPYRNLERWCPVPFYKE